MNSMDGANQEFLEATEQTLFILRKKAEQVSKKFSEMAQNVRVNLATVTEQTLEHNRLYEQATQELESAGAEVVADGEKLLQHIQKLSTELQRIPQFAQQVRELKEAVQILESQANALVKSNAKQSSA